MFDYSKLAGRIKEKVGYNANLAIQLKITEETLGKKLNNKSYFDQTQILQICKILEIPKEEISFYFFETKTL